jgi:transposase
MLLLSDQGYDVESLANIFGTTRQAIYRWFDRYEADGTEGLRTKTRSGCPPKLEVTNQNTVSTVKRLLEEEPRNLNLVLAKIEQELGEKLSSRTLSRFLKKLVTDGSASEMG